MENEAAAAEEEFDDFPPQRETPVYEEPAPRYEEPKVRRTAQPAPAPAPERTRMKVNYATPREFAEASEMADNLRARKPVLMNLEACDPETARRLLDFLSGVAYALGGKIKRVSAQAYIITPTNVEVVGSAVDDFDSSGFYF